MATSYKSAKETLPLPAGLVEQLASFVKRGGLAKLNKAISEQVYSTLS